MKGGIIGRRIIQILTGTDRGISPTYTQRQSHTDIVLVLLHLVLGLTVITIRLTIVLPSKSSHCHAPPHLPSSLPSPVHPGSGGAPPIVHSPRSTRDYDMPGSSSVPHPTTDGIMLSSSGNKHQPPPREREYQWSQRNMDAPIQHSPSMLDYRDGDKDLRKHYSHRPSSRPGPIDDRNDRPTSTYSST